MDLVQQLKDEKETRISYVARRPHGLYMGCSSKCNMINISDAQIPAGTVQTLEAVLGVLLCPGRHMHVGENCRAKQQPLLVKFMTTKLRFLKMKQQVFDVKCNRTS